MKTQSCLKVFKTQKYSYLYVYYKFKNQILRIPTYEKYIEGKMTKELFFNSTVKDFDEKNTKIKKLQFEVDKYIQSQIYSVIPTINQKACLRFINSSSERSLKQIILNKRNTKSLVDYIVDYINYRKQRNTKYNTLKEFTTLLSRVKDFNKFNKKETYLNDINMTWSDSFENYLISKPYSDGTIEKTYTILITVLYHCSLRKVEDDIDMNDTFSKQGFKRGIKSRNLANPITLEQLQTLYNHKFDEKFLEQTKIRFCFQCSTGLRFSDISRIKPENIYGDLIVLKPNKTEHLNKVVEIPLNSISKSILKNLNFNTSSFKIENAPYNRNIKTMFLKMQEIYPALRFKNDYTSHCGRDTFISILVCKGVDVKTILDFTGQSSYSVMSRYIGLTNEYKSAQMNKSFSDPNETSEPSVNYKSISPLF